MQWLHRNVRWNRTPLSEWVTMVTMVTQKVGYHGYTKRGVFYVPQIPASPKVVHIVVNAGLGAVAPRATNPPSPAVYIIEEDRVSRN